MKYRGPDESDNPLSFGPFPKVSLPDARAKREHARRLISAGNDPGLVRSGIPERFDGGALIVTAYFIVPSQKCSTFIAADARHS
jgi:hypothetical protein